MGYLRRSEPARGYGEPMEATALVLDDGSTRHRPRRRRPHRRVGHVGAGNPRAHRRRGRSSGRPRAAQLAAHPRGAADARLGEDRRRRRVERARRSATATRSATSWCRRPSRLPRRLRPARLGLGRTIAEGHHRQPPAAARGRHDHRLEPRGALRPGRRRDPGGRRGRRRDLHGRRVRRPSRRRRAGRSGGVVRLRRPAPRARAGLDGGRVRVPPGLCREHRPVRVVPHRAGAQSDCSASGSLSLHCRARAAATPRADRAGAGAVRLRGRDGDLAARATGRAGCRRWPRSERRVALPLLEPPTLEEIRRIRARARAATSSTSRRRASHGRCGTRSCSTCGGRRRSSSASPTAPSSAPSRCRCRRCGSGAPASRPGRASRSASSGSR